jgi:hypothetical protein
MNELILKLYSRIPRVVTSHWRILFMALLMIGMTARVYGADPHPPGDDMPGRPELPITDIIIQIIVAVVVPIIFRK